MASKLAFGPVLLYEGVFARPQYLPCPWSAGNIRLLLLLARRAFLYNFRPFPCRICDTNHSLGRPPIHLVTVKHRDSWYLAGIRLCSCCVLLKCIHFKFGIGSTSFAENAASPRFVPIEFLLRRKKKSYPISLTHFWCETL